MPSNVPAALCHLPSQIVVGASGERTKFCDAVADVEGQAAVLGAVEAVGAAVAAVGALADDVLVLTGRARAADPGRDRHVGGLESSSSRGSARGRCRRSSAPSPAKTPADPGRVLIVGAGRVAQRAVVAMPRPVADDLARAFVHRPPADERETVRACRGGEDGEGCGRKGGSQDWTCPYVHGGIPSGCSTSNTARMDQDCVKRAATRARAAPRTRCAASAGTCPPGARGAARSPPRPAARRWARASSGCRRRRRCGSGPPR